MFTVTIRYKSGMLEYESTVQAASEESAKLIAMADATLMGFNGRIKWVKVRQYVGPRNGT